MLLPEILNRIEIVKAQLQSYGVKPHNIKIIVFLCRADLEEIKNHAVIEIDENNIKTLYGYKMIITEEEKTEIYGGIKY